MVHLLKETIDWGLRIWENRPNVAESSVLGNEASAENSRQGGVSRGEKAYSGQRTKLRSVRDHADLEAQALGDRNA